MSPNATLHGTGHLSPAMMVRVAAAQQGPWGHLLWSPVPSECGNEVISRNMAGRRIYKEGVRKTQETPDLLVQPQCLENCGKDPTGAAGRDLRDNPAIRPAAWAPEGMSGLTDLLYFYKGTRPIETRHTEPWAWALLAKNQTQEAHTRNKKILISKSN